MKTTILYPLCTWKEWIKNGWATIIAHHHATHLIMPRRNLHYSGETRIARCSLLWTMLSPSTKVIFIVAWIHLSPVECDDPAFVWTHKVWRHTWSRRMKWVLQKSVLSPTIWHGPLQVNMYFCLTCWGPPAIANASISHKILCSAHG